MNKVNHSILIISIASALIILGASVALGLRFGAWVGLLSGLGAFTLLISCMLFANRRMSKPRKKKPKKEKKNKSKT